MAVMTYEDIALGWKPDNVRDTVFNAFITLVLLFFVGVGIFLSSIPLPKQTHERRVVIPERIAKFINEQPRPKPKAQPKPKVLPVPPPIPKQFIKSRKEVKKPLTKIQKTARKMAERSGLLALTKQLSGLVDTSSIDKMVGNHIHSGGNIHAQAGVSGKILTAQASNGQIGISQKLHGDGIGAGTVLDNNQRALARRLLASNGEYEIVHNRKSVAHKSDGNSIRGDNLRSEEDVAYVMDEHKSMLHMLYRRARRRHPGLQGKIVFEITILPSGKVSSIRVVSSELHDKSLEQDMIARIRLFDFGARPVQALTVTVPVEFLPS